MNFLQLLASGASLLNFNFQSKSSQSVDSIPKTVQKNQGFQKVTNNGIEQNALNQLPTQINQDQASLLNHFLQNQRQQLINRYLQLNLQLLQGQINNKKPLTEKPLKQNEEDELIDKDAFQQNDKVQNSKKKIKKSVKCGHEDRAHYAKGLCNNCYHKYGRTKKPWNCPHEKLYAGGMCQNCYINMYNKKKRQENGNPQQNFNVANQKREETIILYEQKKIQKRQTEDN